MASVYPARWCTSPLGVVPAGLGDGVGHCHDVSKLPKRASFYFPLLSFGGNLLYSFSRDIIMGFSIPLGMLEAKLGAHSMLQ